MDELALLEEMLQTELAVFKPNQLFKSELKQKLLDRSASRRKKVLYQWLAYAVAGVVAGVTLYGVATIIKKNEGKSLCCESGAGFESGS